MTDREEVVCGTCSRRCRLAEGAIGFCRARRAEGGRVVAANYGRISSIALDPIEKKPIAFFHPGSNILSVGSYGCNLRCPFCQNDGISQRGGDEVPCQTATPAELANLAVRLKDERGNQEIHERGLFNVLVSNGCASEEVIAEIAPLVDAANIDLKGPSQDYYDWVGGDFNAVCKTIATLREAGCHVEVTTLIVPGRNDSDADIDAIAAFIASVSPGIPLHVTRFFPRWRMMDASPTPVATLHRLVAVARRRLAHVLLGNC